MAFAAAFFSSKPFDRVELLSRIRNMLEVRLLHKAIKHQNRILEERVLERTRELDETRLEIIRRLGRAAEYRDNETGLHIIRMSKYSQILGGAAGMSVSDAELLLNASPMHDIGKIGIPDSILLKPGKLDADEWEVMVVTGDRDSFQLVDDNVTVLYTRRGISDVVTASTECEQGPAVNVLSGETRCVSGSRGAPAGRSSAGSHRWICLSGIFFIFDRCK